MEANYTFRQLPKSTTLENWVNATSAGFRFACKAHQRITHINRLKKSEFNELFFKTLGPPARLQTLRPSFVSTAAQF